MGQNHAIEGKFSPVSGAPVDGIFTSSLDPGQGCRAGRPGGSVQGKGAAGRSPPKKIWAKSLAE